MRNLETERLILRPFQSSDLDRFAELAADSDFMRFSLKGALTREEAIQLLSGSLLPDGSESHLNLLSLFARPER